MQRFVVVTGFVFCAIPHAFAADMVPVHSQADGKTYMSPVRSEFIAPPIQQWVVDVGGRYWASTGNSKLDLYVSGPSDLISRLTYTDLKSHSGEVFGRADHITGFFAKGYAGLGKINSGSLQDEDFPPFLPLYSSTYSEQQNGKLGYATVDLGWELRSQRFSFGFFAGYHFYSERLTAYGCTQTATTVTPYICNPSIPASTKVIGQDTKWHGLRLGFNTEWKFAPGWKLTTDVAWLPVVYLNAKDTHFLRPDLVGSTPEIGLDAFSSAQLEAILSYNFTNAWSVGVGGRYWKLNTGNAQAHFETTAVGGFPQPAKFDTERWGAFLQTSYKFGHSPYFDNFQR